MLIIRSPFYINPFNHSFKQSTYPLPALSYIRLFFDSLVGIAFFALHFSVYSFVFAGVKYAPTDSNKSWGVILNVVLDFVVSFLGRLYLVHRIPRVPKKDPSLKYGGPVSWTLLGKY